MLALSTQLIRGSQSYWQISPMVTGPWDTGPDAGAGTFYPYLPDLPLAQVMFLAGLTVAVLAALALPAGPAGDRCAPAAAVTAAGLLAAGTAVALAGTGKLDAHGMIAVPALHDAANDRPVRFTPVCSHTAIPVCLNPAYASYLPATAAALAPVLDQMAGLPGAPARISQAAATYQQGRQRRHRRPGRPAHRRPAAGVPPAPSRSGARTRHHHQRTGRRGAIKRRARHRGQRHRRRPRRIPGAAGGHGGADAGGRRPAQAAATGPRAQATATAPVRRRPGYSRLPRLAYAAARRFAALPAPARHAWLMQHLAALRAGRITLAQLP